jgi:hypothetical protein
MIISGLRGLLEKTEECVYLLHGWGAGRQRGRGRGLATTVDSGRGAPILVSMGWIESEESADDFS